MSAVIDRRTFLVGAGASALLAACGGSSTNATDGLAAARFSAPFTVVANGTPQRTVWGIADQAGPLPANDVPERVVISIAQNGELIAPRVDVFARADGVPFPYYPLSTSFEAPGVYDVELSWNGGALQSAVQAFAPEEVALLQPGAAMPEIDTPTIDDPRGVDPICTRGETCPFHEVTLADALADGSPTVLVVSTPGFCQTAVCGPMLELLIEAHGQRPGGFSAVHAEVYDNPQALATGAAVPTEIMDATGLTQAGFEPSMFFIDADGVLAERLDNVVDRSEMNEALDRLLA